MYLPSSSTDCSSAQLSGSSSSQTVADLCLRLVFLICERELTRPTALGVRWGLNEIRWINVYKVVSRSQESKCFHSKEHELRNHSHLGSVLFCSFLAACCLIKDVQAFMFRNPQLYSV